LDVAETILVDIDPREAVLGVDAAVAPGTPHLFADAGTNVAHAFEERWDDDVLADADVVVRARIVHQRLAAVPMETNGMVAVPAPSGAMTVWVSTQVPFDVRDDLAETLGLERERVRVIAPDVGGGFGAKLAVYPEYLAVATAASRLRRPVAWQESRSESMVGLTHGRAQVHDIELGATRDGDLVGLRVDVLGDMGAYAGGALLPVTTKTMLPGCYRIAHVASRGRAIVTNAVPVDSYRGAGRPEATLSIERAMDLLARALEMDPVALRRRNLIETFPHTTAVGSTYDAGAYDEALDRALALADVEQLRREQTDRRARGDAVALGVGVALYVEVTGFSRKEFASVAVGDDGSVTVRAGTSSHGQGHETAFAQIASGVLGVAPGAVRVVHSDTGEVPRGQGTYGSRSLQIAGSSVFEAAETVRERAVTLAAHALEVAAADVVTGPDGLVVAGAPEIGITWSEVAALANDPARVPDGAPAGLTADVRRFQPDYTYPFGAHVAVVEVDTETGDVRLIRHIAVDDCGRILNPMLVEGQVHGGLAQGIAQALFEEVVYDELGSPVTPNLATYAMPAASELPWFERGVMETPTPLNPLGAKGIGESATIGSTPAIVNAVMDALAPFGVRHLDPPLTPEKVWRVIRETST
ncbi:MAG TPA: molybdopterin cofactor-binding domain-containing protein, partial [Actinomycetota bacterium]|nr:molybdopterin cofactor-binding domain-containing protein [Actinomycetota bacterium]